MPKYVDFEDEHKSRHDSRIEFGKTLVDLLRSILRKSTVYQDKNGVSNEYRFKMWASGLRHYYSITYVFMPKDVRENVLKRLNRILDVVESYHRYVSCLSPKERESLPQKLRRELFDLQDVLYGKTIHLLTPINNDDDDEDFTEDDIKKIFG